MRGGKRLRCIRILREVRIIAGPRAAQVFFCE
jgi:hypothetical protein